MTFVGVCRLNPIGFRLFAADSRLFSNAFGCPRLTAVWKNLRSLSHLSTMSESSLLALCKQLVPPLSKDRHKGQAGRIGVFGGSLEYTGAPYFAAISALKVGADLVHVFCSSDAGPVIKSYSPELIVHPLLNHDDAVEKITPWLDRLHVILIGPGLGRELATFEVVIKIINVCKEQRKPLVIDADGLFLVANHPEIIKNYPPPGVVLTPNVMEFARLMEVDSFKANNEIFATAIEKLGKNVTVVCKGADDIIFNKNQQVTVSGGGSGRRCGGQGDLLSGAVATFLGWSLSPVGNPIENGEVVACFAACKLTRECNARAFKKMGRAMTCSDMIAVIHEVFKDEFERTGD